MPEPLPALSTSSQDQELDVTLDETATSGTENTQHDTEQETSAQGGEKHQIHRKTDLISFKGCYIC